MMTDRQGSASRNRPSVSVVMPFLGDPAEAREALGGLGALRRRTADQLILVDNTPDGLVEGLATAGVDVVVATTERSSYHARNVGAEHADNEWLLFVDADCKPAETLLDDYFESPIAEGLGAVAGTIVPADQRALLARWAASRRILSQEASLGSEAPAAATANLLVRRAAWAAVGGFLEGVRSGADFEFCWRLRDAGWEIGSRPGAVVRHLHRETLAGVVRQLTRYAAGNAWQRRRRPRAARRQPAARPLGRAALGTVGYAFTARFEQAAMKAVDGMAVICQTVGWLLGNGVPREAAAASVAAGTGKQLVLATDRFPVPSETFVINEVRALERLGWRVRFEAVARPDRPVPGGTRSLAVSYLEDEGALDRAVALAWLLVRHPVRCIRDRVECRRWSVEERLPLRALGPQARRLARGGDRHVHVHFAALAAVNALRVGRIVGVPVSVTAHGHEIFATPRSLREKLERAAFAVAPCEYTAGYLRGVAPDGRLETIGMGVDGDRFRRRTRHGQGRTVAGIGRLVPKKGFGFLVEAAAMLNERGSLDRLVIAGDGPLGDVLEEQIERAGLQDRARLLGLIDADGVHDLLENVDLLAVPCVIAPDGDRDAMPVVAKEALAMEVPVVASDEVGLPEIVKPAWGRLVNPGDPYALAQAMDELLCLPLAERVAMGKAGRAFVLEHFDLLREGEKLASLIVETAPEDSARPF